MKTKVGMGSLLAAFLIIGVLTGTTCETGQWVGVPDTADLTRGGSMYDKWWAVTGATEPTSDHALWATRPDTTSNTRTGSATWRCKECHGWDYEGVNGAYSTGSHRTGIMGILGTTKTAQEVFDLIKDTHGFGTVMLDTDIWDLVKFVCSTEGAQYDTALIISGADQFTGSATTGQTLYTNGIGTGTACVGCHGADGKTIPPGAPATFDDWVGKVSNENPWEFQHKVRFGQPGTAMPASTANGGTEQNVNDLSTFAQTLPQS